jgi:hypothetical protein
MKKILLAIVLVLAMAIPAFAQNGPVKIKILMVYTETEEGGLRSTTAWFNTGDYVFFGIAHEQKGTGSYKLKMEIRNSEGALIYKDTSTDSVNSPTFEALHQSFQMGTPIDVAGYYTIKVTFTDVKTGNKWSKETKIHVSPPPPPG